MAAKFPLVIGTTGFFEELQDGDTLNATLSQASTYEMTFTNATLSIAGVLVLNHNLTSYPSGVAIYNASGELIVPDKVEIASVNAIAIDLASFQPLSGTWSVSVTQ